MSQSRFPQGWGEKRVQKVLEHYESLSEDEAVAEDEAADDDPSQTFMASWPSRSPRTGSSSGCSLNWAGAVQTARTARRSSGTLQPDYRLVHALFVDDADLAPVLFDASDLRDPLHGVGFWLKQLQAGRTTVTPVQLRARLQATDANWQFSDAEMLTALGHLENYGYVKRLRSSQGEERVLL